MTQRKNSSLAAEALAGVAAGCAATVPMTAAMEIMWRRLPRDQQYPLPPSELTAHLVERGLLGARLDQRGHAAATLVMHLAIGAGAGVVAGPLIRRLSLPTIVSGMLAGIGVWATGYLVTMPSLGILRSTTKWPASRRRLMFVAHLVWGAALGALTPHTQASGPRRSAVSGTSEKWKNARSPWATQRDEKESTHAV